MNNRMNPSDFAFLHLDPEDENARLHQHASALSNARVEQFNAKHAMMREHERLINLQKRGIRHKNKMHVFHERVEVARLHVLQLEENPLTHMLKEIPNEPQ